MKYLIDKYITGLKPIIFILVISPIALFNKSTGRMCVCVFFLIQNSFPFTIWQDWVK